MNWRQFASPSAAREGLQFHQIMESSVSWAQQRFNSFHLLSAGNNVGDSASASPTQLEEKDRQEASGSPSPTDSGETSTVDSDNDSIAGNVSEPVPDDNISEVAVDNAGQSVVDRDAGHIVVGHAEEPAIGSIGWFSSLLPSIPRLNRYKDKGADRLHESSLPEAKLFSSSGDSDHVVCRRKLSEGCQEQIKTCRRTIMEDVMDELEDDDLEEWRTIFNLFDADGDQTITGEELGVVLRSMGQNPTEQELQEMINEMDEDGSGTVDFEEFVILMKRKTADSESDGYDDIEAAFRVFDRNNDGVITEDELAAVMISLGNPRTPEEIKAMIEEEDHDKDGVIKKEEFIRMLTDKKKKIDE